MEAVLNGGEAADESILESPEEKKEALLKKQSEARAKNLQREQPSPDPEDEETEDSEPKPIREKMVSNAVQFLSHPNVKKTPLARQIAFLQNKGLTNDEINESLKRVNGTPSIPQSTPQPIISAPEIAPRPVLQITPPPPPPPPRSTFRTVATTMILTLGAAGGLAWIFKSFLLRSLQIDQKQTIPGASGNSHGSHGELIRSPGTPIPQIQEETRVDTVWREQMTELVQAVKTQQNEMKNTLNIVNTVLTTPERFTPKKATDQVDVKELTNAITALHTFLQTNKTQPQPSGLHSGSSTPQFSPGYSQSNSTPLRAAQPPSVEVTPLASKPPSSSILPPNPNPLVSKPIPSSQPPVNANPTGYSQNFLDVIQKVRAGETLPGINEIDDSPIDPKAVVSPSTTAKPSKPWEARRKTRQTLWSDSPTEQKIPSYLNAPVPSSTPIESPVVENEPSSSSVVENESPSQESSEPNPNPDSDSVDL